MARKENKKPRLSATDILISTLLSLTGGISLFIIIILAGSFLFPNSANGTAEEAPTPEASRFVGEWVSSYTVLKEIADQKRAEAGVPTPGPAAEPEPPSAEPSEPPQTQDQAPSPTQAQTAGPFRAQAPSTPTPTRAPTPTRNPAAQNPGPVVSINPTAPPVQQTQTPAQSWNQGNYGQGWNTETFSRDNWPRGKFLGSVDSDKYHNSNCRGAQRIRPENERWFNSEEEARAAGYERCGYCW